jgi:hypothetical protein
MLRTVAERPHVSANRFGARCCPVFSGRLPREFPENAIELRQGLKARGERNLTYAQIDIVQKCARLFESCAGNVFDEVNPGHLLELLAQMIPADVDRLCHLGQRKLFIRMLVDKFPRFPDFDRLRSIPLSRTNSLQLR